MNPSKPNVHELDLEATALEMLKLVTKYNSHVDASRCPEWMSDALIRLEDKGIVIHRSVTIHYGVDRDGVEATTNYIGFFLK